MEQTKVNLIPIDACDAIYVSSTFVHEHVLDAAYCTSRAVEKDISLIDKRVYNIIASDHMSILEHVTLSFMLIDAPIYVLRQLMRHRLASYVEQSMRYTKAPNRFIKMRHTNSYRSEQNEIDMIQASLDYYNELLELGVAKEVARTILPQSMCVPKILVTMNLRELFTMFKLRLAEDAQYETRKVTFKILKLACKAFPKVFTLRNLLAFNIHMAKDLIPVPKELGGLMSYANYSENFTREMAAYD